MRALAGIALATALALAAGCGSSNEQTGTGSGPPPATSSTAPQAPVGVRAKSCDATHGTLGPVRVTGISCSQGLAAVTAWMGRSDCTPAASESHSSCRVGHLVCIGSVAGSGLAVTCAGPGRSISFIRRR